MGTPFEDFAGTLFLKNSAGIPFFLKRGAKYKKRAKDPPFFWKKGPSQIIETEMYHINRARLPSVSIGKIPGKYQPLPTENPELVNKSTKSVNIYKSLFYLAVRKDGAAILTKKLYCNGVLPNDVTFFALCQVGGFNSHATDPGV